MTTSSAAASKTLAIGRAFAIGRAPWKTFDPFLFCAYHNDTYPNSAKGSLGPEPKLLRDRELTSDFSGLDGWSMYHGTEVPGFPSHPHYGFETVTVAMKGLVDHFDSLGATGRYGNGDVQWLTTGNGVQHSEMFPLLNETAPNPLDLFQLWLNLPAAKKTAEPNFEMFWAPQVPVVTIGDATVTVIAGAIGAVKPMPPPPDSWAATPENEVAIWVVKIPQGGKVTLPGARHGSEINRALYVYRGTGKGVKVTSEGDAAAIARDQALQIDASHQVELQAEGGDVEVLVLQGRPIREPVVQRGPFVANSQDELMTKFAEFRRTEFGGWPWPSSDHHHPREQTRFALRPGAKEREYPPQA